MKAKLIVSSLIFIFMLGLITASENNITICKEQLQNTLDLYNNCSYDYQQGYNCGTITDLLKDNNKKLSDSLHDCQNRKWIYLGISLIAIAVFIWDIIERRKSR